MVASGVWLVSGSGGAGASKRKIGEDGLHEFPVERDCSPATGGFVARRAKSRSRYIEISHSPSVGKN